MTNLPRSGELFAGRFLVDAKVGAGGMGTVFRAHDTRSDRLVALKLIEDHSESAETERFTREAQVLAELSSAHIVGYVAHGTDDQGRPYLAMEWLEGEDLSKRLLRGRMSLHESLAIVRGTASALAIAHEHGIVHRDLKPSNLFLREGDPARVVVVDFGIARTLFRSVGLTSTGMLIGTPGYMAPEQARGERTVGPSADMFSLGCVFFECLTGHPLFHGEHAAAILVKVLFEDPPHLQAVCDSLPEPLSALLRRMVQKDVADRIPHGMALVDAVCRIELPTNAHADSVGATMPGRLSLSEHDEQKIFSLAFAVPRQGRDGWSESQIRERHAAYELIRQSLRSLGAGVEQLADGSIIATVFPSGSATDQVFLAARCALILKEHFVDFDIAVTTGRGFLHGKMPFGEAVDRAMQLLSGRTSPGANEASSSGIWLDELSERLLGGRFNIERQDGIAKLLREHDWAIGDDVRRLLGQATPCVGREQELSMLESTLSACTDDSMARAVIVVAPPGMGKSRLRHEFLRLTKQRRPDVVLAMGRADLANPGASYGILAQCIRHLCGITEEDSLAVQQQRLRERIERHLTKTMAPRVVVFLGELCRIPCSGEGVAAFNAAREDPKIMHDQITGAFLDWLRAETAQAPVLLVLEDLHWGDALSVQLLEQALRELAELPLCILMLARPEAQQMFPSLWGLTSIQILRLPPLGRRACEPLAQDVLRRALGNVVAPEDIARIVGQSAGHPLFLEELVRGVAENRSDGLPETVLAMLVARPSQIDTGARQALRAASIFGEAFSRGAVEAILDHGSRNNALDVTLDALVRGEFIERQRDGRDRYRFRHALVRDAAYSSWTDDHRVLAHRLACRYLMGIGGVEPAVLAEHGFKGGDMDVAARHYVAAAADAMGRFDLAAARRHAQQALECGVKGEDLGIVQAVMSWCCHFGMDQFAGYEYALQAIENLPPGTRWWTKAMGIVFYAFFLLNRTEHAERLISAFMQADPAPDARLTYCEAGEMLAFFFITAAQWTSCEQIVRKMAIIANDVPPEERGHLYLARGWKTFYTEPDAYAGYLLLRDAIAAYRHVGDRAALPQATFLKGIIASTLGLDESEAVLREARAIAMETQNAFYAVITHVHLGFYLALQPLPEKQEEARAIAMAYVNQPNFGPGVVGAAHFILARGRFMAGDFEGANQALVTGESQWAAMASYWLQSAALHLEVQVALGRATDANQFADIVADRFVSTGILGDCDITVRKAIAKARLAAGTTAAGLRCLRNLVDQLRLRTNLIEDPAIRTAYLQKAENQDALRLARQYGLSDAIADA